MNIKTKIVTALTLAVLIVPGVSLAQTMSTAALQAEIATLTAQLQSLKTQLAAAGGSTNTWCYTFNSNLSIGMSGNAVTELQTALQKDGESVTVTGTFDDQTASAVTAFQEKYQTQILAPYGLSYGTGYAGKSTRAELNSLFGCTGSNPVTPPIVVNPVGPAPVIPPVTSELPDLTFQNLVVSNYSPAINQSVSIGFDLVNQGNAVASPAQYSYTSQADGSSALGSATTCMGSTVLQPGQSCHSEYSFTFPTAGAKVLTVVADPQSLIQESNASSHTLTISLSVGGTSTSTSTPPSPLPVSPTLTLSAVTNPAFTSGNVIAGTASAKIASFLISNSISGENEGIAINNIYLKDGENAGMFQNLRVLVNGSQFGATQPVLISQSFSGGSGSTFTGNAIIPAGSIATVDVFADVLSSAQSGSANTITLNGCSASGQTSGSSYREPVAQIRTGG